MHYILIYAGILVGIVLEGEMIMLSSVIAAHRGFLNLWMAMGIGFAGTLGYMSGEIIKNRLAHIENIELLIIGVLLLAGILIYFANRMRK